MNPEALLNLPLAPMKRGPRFSPTTVRHRSSPVMLVDFRGGQGVSPPPPAAMTYSLFENSQRRPSLPPDHPYQHTLVGGREGERAGTDAKNARTRIFEHTLRPLARPSWPPWGRNPGGPRSGATRCGFEDRGRARRPPRVRARCRRRPRCRRSWDRRRAKNRG